MVHHRLRVFSMILVLTMQTDYSELCYSTILLKLTSHYNTVFAPYFQANIIIAETPFSVTVNREDDERRVSDAFLVLVRFGSTGHIQRPPAGNQCYQGC